jgi:hypothetical protein
MGLSFISAAGPRQHSHSQVRDLRVSWPYFTVPDSRLPQTGGPGPRIYNPQALGSLFVASYDSQGYGGGIRSCFHTPPSVFYTTWVDRTSVFPFYIGIFTNRKIFLHLGPCWGGGTFFFFRSFPKVPAEWLYPVRSNSAGGKLPSDYINQCD